MRPARTLSSVSTDRRTSTYSGAIVANLRWTCADLTTPGLTGDPGADDNAEAQLPTHGTLSREPRSLVREFVVTKGKRVMLEYHLDDWDACN